MTEQNTGWRDTQSALESTENLVREIDVILHGEEGAAPQAVLCDMVEPIRALQAQCDELEAERDVLRQELDGVLKMIGDPRSVVNGGEDE